VTDAELDKAKHRFRSDLESCYDDLDSLCGWFGGTELFSRPRSQEQRARELDRVRAADVQRVARRVIRRERLNVAVVGSLGRSLSGKVSRIVQDFR
jgi:predicted Zn-dependent peptidase